MGEIIGIKIVKTRKPHICFGCAREFPTGTIMERSFVTDEKPWTCYLCPSCQEVKQHLEWNDEFGYGELREEALEYENSQN